VCVYSGLANWPPDLLPVYVLCAWFIDLLFRYAHGVPLKIWVMLICAWSQPSRTWFDVLQVVNKCLKKYDFYNLWKCLGAPPVPDLMHVHSRWWTQRHLLEAYKGHQATPGKYIIWLHMTTFDWMHCCTVAIATYSRSLGREFERRRRWVWRNWVWNVSF
jgi:hypothetical protein